MPTAEASTPSVSASATTEVSTWRRLAPRARSIANSRRRWATVMLKALKMMNAPTKTETPANARSTGVRNEPIASAVSAVASAAACSPVLTLTPAGMAALTSAASSLGVTPGIGGDGDAADPAGLAAPALHVLQAAGDDDGAAEGAGVAPLEDAGDLDLLEAGRGGDGEAVAGLETGLVGEALDDRDLVAPLDLAAGDQGRLVEGLARLGREQGGGAAGLDGLAVDDRGAHRLVDAGGLVDAGDRERPGRRGRRSASGSRRPRGW